MRTSPAHANRIAISASELAEQLGVSKRHIERLDAQGKLPAPARIGHAKRWPVDEIDKWLHEGCPNRERWADMRDAAETG